MFKKIIKLYKTFKMKQIAEKQPDLLPYVLHGLEYNEAHKEKGWRAIIEINGPVTIDPVIIQEELDNSLLAVGYGCSLKADVGNETTTLIISKNDEVLLTMEFFNNNRKVIMERVNGMIGIDTRLLCAILENGTRNTLPQK